MAVNLSSEFNTTQFKSDGTLAVGFKIWTFAQGSTTPLPTFTTSAGNVAQSNPIILNARGEVDNLIQLTAGLAYKLVLTDASGDNITIGTNVTIRTEDNIRGINDTTSTVDQWLASGLIPTFVSATSFTLVGDQTTNFHVGRRIKCTVTAGTVYATITVSAFTTLTTITVVVDSGILDSGLSAVSYGILTNTNNSLPSIAARSGANSDITSLLGLTTPLSIAQGGAGNQSVTCTQAAGALTFGLAATSLSFRSLTLTDGTSTVVRVASPLTLVLPSGGTLGAPTTVQQRIVTVAINNAGTPELAIINLAGGNDLSETGLINTVAISAASTANNVFYSTTARTGVAYRVVEVVDAVNTAGAWATPVLVQGAGGNAITAMSSLGYGQTWQNVTGIRTSGTTYFNTTGKPIFILASWTGASAAGNMTVSGVVLPSTSNFGGSQTIPTFVIVPASASYIFTTTLGTASFYELR